MGRPGRLPDPIFMKSRLFVENVFAFLLAFAQHPPQKNLKAYPIKHRPCQTKLLATTVRRCSRSAFNPPHSFLGNWVGRVGSHTELSVKTGRFTSPYPSAGSRLCRRPSTSRLRVDYRWTTIGLPSDYHRTTTGLSSSTSFFELFWELFFGSLLG